MQELLKKLMPMGFGSQRCPDCDHLIASEEINIREGVALCPKCGKLSRLSDLCFSTRSVAEILAKPPSGCSIVSDGQRTVVTASLRSLVGCFFTTGFALFWNSITSIFVLVAIAGLYANLVGPLPNWFPAPGLQEGKPEMDGGPMNLGMTLFLCVFLLPFVTIGVGVAGAAVMNLIGKVEVVIDQYQSHVATGFGLLKWRRRFDPREVQSVEFGSASWQSEGGANRLIEINADQRVRFGSMLNPDRSEWLRAVLKEILVVQFRGDQRIDLPGMAWLSQRTH